MNSTTSPGGYGPGDVADEVAAAALAMARCFSRGATLWCISPRHPAHARHVAVEFVHPVVVGKRALPARYLDGRDPMGALRLLARPGDIVAAIGEGADPVLEAVVRRADAWGLTGLWLGAGRPPSPGVAHHVLWCDGIGVDEAAAAGELVLLYHLLWELTHVVFEHPGLLRPEPSCAGEVCITCSDEGRLAEVAELAEAGTAAVLAGGRRETIDVSLVRPVAPGDLVLVHAGVALTVIEESTP